MLLERVPNGERAKPNYFALRERVTLHAVTGPLASD